LFPVLTGAGGTGAGRVQRATGSGYLIAGETITASIEGIGTLTHTVVAEESVPDDLSGAQLPPVSTYRRGRGGGGGGKQY